MSNYRDLLDVVYIDHPSNLMYRDEYIKSFASEFDIKSVVGKDGDLEYGRRLQLQACSKKYCMLTDADDIFLHKNIKRLISYLEKDPTLDASVGWDVVFKDKPSQEVFKKNWRPMPLTARKINISPIVMHNAIVWRTDVLKKFMDALPIGYAITNNFDFDFKYAFLEAGHKVVKFSEVGTYYRSRRDGQNYLSKYKHLITGRRTLAKIV